MDKEANNPVYRKEKIWTVEELCKFLNFKYENGFVKQHMSGPHMNIEKIWRAYPIGEELIPNFKNTSFLFKLVFLSGVVGQVIWEGGLRGPRTVSENKILTETYMLYNPFITAFSNPSEFSCREKPLYFCLSRCGCFVFKRKKNTDMEALRFLEERLDFLDGRPVRKTHTIDIIIKNPFQWAERMSSKAKAETFDWTTWKLKKKQG